MVSASKNESAKVPKKDDLMDALMAIDDDLEGDDDLSLEEDDDPEMEEIVFEADDLSVDDDVDVVEEDAVSDTVGAQESEASTPIQEIVSIKTDAEEEEGTVSSISASASLADDKSSTQEKPSMDVANLEEDASLVKVKIEDGNEDVPDSKITPGQAAAAIGTGTESFDLMAPEESGSFDFDAEDEDLEDLENFLMKAGEK